LIDGLLTIHALKELGRKTVEVNVIECPDADCYVQSIRFNNRHGLPFTKQDRDIQIWQLHHIEKRTLEEVAELVQLSTSGVQRRYEALIDLNNSNPENAKVAKVDNRVKVDKEEVVKYLAEGTPQKDIAEKMNVSEALISQIKKHSTKYEIAEADFAIARTSYDLKFELNHLWHDNEKFFAHASLHHQIYPVKMWFMPEGVYTDVRIDRDITYATFSDKSVFQFYDLKKPASFEMEKQIEPTHFRTMCGEKGNPRLVIYAKNGKLYFEAGLDLWLQPEIFKEIETTRPNIIDSIDADGRLNNCDFSFKIPFNVFENSPIFVNDTSLKLEGDNFTLSGEMKNGWITHKRVIVEEKQGADFKLKPWGDLNYWSRYPRANIISGKIDGAFSTICFVFKANLYKEMTLFRCRLDEDSGKTQKHTPSNIPAPVIIEPSDNDPINIPESNGD